MFRRLRLPSPALVVASLALLVALGGSAGAAALLVTSKDIKDGTIQGRDIGRRTVAPSNLIQGKDSGLDADRLDGMDSAALAALPGPASSIAGTVSVRTQTFTLASQVGNEFSSACIEGETVVGGGMSTDGIGDLFDSYPKDAKTWAVVVANIGDQQLSGAVYALCAA